MSRKNPWSKRGPAGPWDAIVIGSGMGGMTAAALLAQLGQKVLVLEQHYVPGGFTHTFRRKGYTWDVGVHAVGEVTRHSMTGRLLHLLSDGNLEWASLGPVYDRFWFPDGLQLDFPDSPQQFRQNLIDAFPLEAEAIDQYLLKVREVAGQMKGYYLARTAPKGLGGAANFLLGRKAQRSLLQRTGDVINGLTEDPRLRAVFAAQWGYYGSTPSRSSFAIQALVVKHFLHGGYYPVGGSGRIAETLLQKVADQGGWTRVNAPVDQILIEGGKAVGVRMEDGEELRAPVVVSAAGITSTMHRMLPAEVVDQQWVQDTKDLPPASAHVCLYLAFKGDIEAAGAGSANQWFWHTWDTEHDAWQVQPEGPQPDAPILYVSFPSLKDPEHDAGPEQKHTGEIVTFVPWEVFEPWKDSAWKRRPGAYEAFKQSMTDSLLEQFFKHRPELEPLLQFAELGTPLSTDHFVRPMRGSIYGIEPTPERFQNPWLKPRSPVPGLFFAGSEVSTVGVIGAMMGGVLGAAAVEPRAVMKLLKGL